MTDDSSGSGKPRRRLGAYVLPGDPVWLTSSLERYYELIDDLVVVVPEDGLGWLGRPLPIDECLASVRRVDRRGLLREEPGKWVDRQHPRDAEVAQRTAALAA